MCKQSVLALLQVQTGLKQLDSSVPWLCVRANNDSCSEIHTDDANDTFDAECIAHSHQAITMHNVNAPTLSYLQQLATNAGKICQLSPDRTDADVDVPSLDALHVLYEWIGATSCGIAGKWVYFCPLMPKQIGLCYSLLTRAPCLLVIVMCTSASHGTLALVYTMCC